jgi:hypothetical protein
MLLLSKLCDEVTQLCAALQPLYTYAEDLPTHAGSYADQVQPHKYC